MEEKGHELAKLSENVGDKEMKQEWITSSEFQYSVLNFRFQLTTLLEKEEKDTRS